MSKFVDYPKRIGDFDESSLWHCRKGPSFLNLSAPFASLSMLFGVFVLHHDERDYDRVQLIADAGQRLVAE